MNATSFDSKQWSGNLSAEVWHSLWYPPCVLIAKIAFHQQWHLVLIHTFMTNLWSLINISAKINIWRTAQSTERFYENLTWELYLIIQSTVLCYVFRNVLLQPSLPLYFQVSVGSRISIPCITALMNDGGPIHMDDTNLHSAIWYYRRIMDD